MADGDIGTVIDTLVFDATRAVYPFIIQVSDTIFAIAYSGPDVDGFIATVEIDASGNIGAAVIDTLEFDAITGNIPILYHISGNVFAVLYTNIDSDAIISTFTISAAGDISAAVIETCNVDVWGSGIKDIVHVSGIYYAVVFKGYGSDGYVVTISISAAGDIGASEIDRLEFDTVSGLDPSIVQVSDTIFAISYTGPGSDGVIKTVSISNVGEIGASAIDTFIFDAVLGSNTRILNIAGDIFAVSYGGSGFAGTVVTIDIDASGNIGAAVIDSLVFDANASNFIDFVLCSPGLYAVAYQGAGADGFCKTFTISDAGDISAAVVDTFEFDTDSCTELSFKHITGNVYVVAYSNTSFVGNLLTFDIETPTDAAPRHLLLMGIG